MTREDLPNLVDGATLETLPDLIRDLEAAKARALARVATWAAAPRNADAEPLTLCHLTEILGEVTRTPQARKLGHLSRLGPDTDPAMDDAPSAKGMFSCMVAVAVMLVLYLLFWLIFTS